MTPHTYPPTPTATLLRDILDTRTEDDGPYKFHILDVCHVLHSEKTGTGDALSDAERAELVAFLEYRIAHWHRHSDHPYDHAVKLLMFITLQEQRS